jgi:glycine oxidase
MRDVIVVGGGVIGLSIAHAIAAGGKSVLVLDPGETVNAASWAAAGMLAPQSEADTPDPLFELCTASLRLYRDWIRQLQVQSGIDPEFQEPGLLYIASSAESLNALKRRVAWQQELGLDSEVLTPDEIRQMEPQLTMPMAGGVHMPGECQVTPRKLLAALQNACAASGVEIRKDQWVREILRNGDRVHGVLTDSDSISAAYIVIASGARSAEILGLWPPLPVVPRKGQMLSLDTPEPLFQKLIRWEHAYMVQRPCGELIVGATNENAGFDRRLTPEGIGGLLANVQQMSAYTAPLAIKEMWTGLRPATPDGLPILGIANPSGGGELIYASGHYRNGILLAPITASIVASLVENRAPVIPLAPFSPLRFEV